MKNFIPNKAMAGVVDYVDARDIPGENDWQHGPSQVESSCKACAVEAHSEIVLRNSLTHPGYFRRILGREIKRKY